MKLRLTAKGFENFTGQMGVHYFKEGLSINDVLYADGIRIAAAIGAEWEDGSHANIGSIYSQNMHTPTPTVLQQAALDKMRTETMVKDANQAIAQTTSVAEAQFKAEGINVPATAQPVAADSVGAVDQPVTQVDGVKYTRADLVAIADEKGLAGLRVVGEEVGVKSGSINGLIDAILAVAGKSE